MDALTFEKVFPLFNLGKFTSFLLFNKNGRTLMPIRPSYFSLTHMEMNLVEYVFGLTNNNPDTQNLLTQGTPRIILFHMKHNLSTTWSGLLMSLSTTIFIQSKTYPRFSPKNPRARLSSI
jgi:hypothetical protein